MVKRARPVALALFAVVAILALAAYQPAEAVNWRQAEGTSLVLGFNKHAYADALQPLVPEFEALTGIKVTFEVYAQDEFMNKRLIDLSSGAGVFDIVMMDQSVVQYANAGWIEPLDDYFANPDLVDLAEYDFDDYLPAMLKEGTVNGRLYALPITGEAQILFYRKDLFEEKGLKVPETFEELHQTAVALHKPGEIAGILLRGQKIHTAWGSSGFVWSYGGRIFDDPDNPTKSAFNSPEAAEAITMYAKLLQDAGPPGVGNYTWYEAVADFQQGKAAMYIDSSVFMSEFENPDKSTVAGKVGYAPMPKGPAGRFSNTLAWMISMSSSSKNKVGAFLFLVWATGKETTLKVGATAGTSARESVYQSQGVKERYPADWAEAAIVAMKSDNPEPGFPRIMQIDEWLDIYGGAVNATILKQGDALSNLNRAAAQMDRLLR